MNHITCPHCRKRKAKRPANITNLPAIIQQKVLQHFNVTSQVLTASSKGNKQGKDVGQNARYTLAYLLYHYCAMSHRQIAKLLGRDNTSQPHAYSQYAVQSIRNCIESRDWIYDHVMAIEKEIEEVLEGKK